MDGKSDLGLVRLWTWKDGDIVNDGIKSNSGGLVDLVESSLSMSSNKVMIASGPYLSTINISILCTLLGHKSFHMLKILMDF